MNIGRTTIQSLQMKTLTHFLSFYARLQSSQLAEPLWIDPGLKSGTGVRELIPTPPTPTKTKKKMQAGNELPLNVPPNSSQARKKPSSG